MGILDFVVRNDTILLQASVMLLGLALGLRLQVAPATPVTPPPVPRRLTSAVALSAIIFPLVAMSVLSLAEVPRPVAIGAMLAAISPLAPLLPRRGAAIAGREITPATGVATMVLSLVTIPLWLSLMSWIFVQDAQVRTEAVVRLATSLFILPLLLGMTLRRLAPGAAGALSNGANVASTLLLLVIGIPFTGEVVPTLARVDVRSACTLLGVAACTLFGGRIAAGAESSDGSTFAIAAAARHPAFALLVARANFPGEYVTPAVLATFAAGALVSLPYAAWRWRHRRSESAVAAVPPVEDVV